jgi:hypothetical protein
MSRKRLENPKIPRSYDPINIRFIELLEMRYPKMTQAASVEITKKLEIPSWRVSQIKNGYSSVKHFIPSLCNMFTTEEIHYILFGTHSLRVGVEGSSSTE